MWQEPNSVPYPHAWHEQAAYRSAPSYQPASGGWPAGAPQPEPTALEADIALAKLRKGQRSARNMKIGSAILAIGTTAIFLVALASHQLDQHIEFLTPVLLLTCVANFQRAAARQAKCRAAESALRSSHHP